MDLCLLIHFYLRLSKSPCSLDEIRKGSDFRDWIGGLRSISSYIEDGSIKVSTSVDLVD